MLVLSLVSSPRVETTANRQMLKVTLAVYDQNWRFMIRVIISRACGVNTHHHHHHRALTMKLGHLVISHEVGVAMNLSNLAESGDSCPHVTQSSPPVGRLSSSRAFYAWWLPWWQCIARHNKLSFSGGTNKHTRRKTVLRLKRFFQDSYIRNERTRGSL